MEYKSKEELYFSWWLDDLKSEGIIEAYQYEPNTFNLSTAHFYDRLILLKTKTKRKEKKLLDIHDYTPDFVVRWNKKHNGLFYRTINGYNYSGNVPFFCNISKKDGEHYTFFEVKGTFDYMNMTRIFTLNQKWLYDKWKLYVQLAAVPGIFKSTFTPSRYLLTDKATTNRKISFDIRMLSDYINQISPSKLHLGDTINF